jgi:hypothetical protein
VGSHLVKVGFPVGTPPIGPDTQRAFELTVILTAQSPTGATLGFAAYFDLGIVQVIK